MALDARGYITVIHLAGESDDLAFSKEVFVAAKTAGVAFNGDGYGTVISVAGKAEDLVFIKEVFTTAKEAKVALDNISYTIMIDAAGQNGDVSLAKSLFDTFFERFGERFIHKKNDRKEIELHFLNYWTAYFLLLRSDLEKLLRINTRIIFGKGIHTKKKNPIKYKMIHDTRRATIDALGEVFPKQKYIFNKLAGNTDIGHFDFENGSLIFPAKLKLERKKSMPEKLAQECIPQEEVACGGKQSTCRKK
ncbi:hypothetical protein [Candidiatus Paracoxiella cheracis]|uniref:hypothetical protein n=1 Tax=Candidiatus Paracoxiella cheracis TaxID=3405120 RepID=UPI003BF463C8